MRYASSRSSYARSPSSNAASPGAPISSPTTASDAIAIAIGRSFVR
jgi:hypothetical protein